MPKSNNSNATATSTALNAPHARSASSTAGRSPMRGGLTSKRPLHLVSHEFLPLPTGFLHSTADSYTRSEFRVRVYVEDKRVARRIASNVDSQIASRLGGSPGSSCGRNHGITKRGLDVCVVLEWRVRKIGAVHVPL